MIGVYKRCCGEFRYEMRKRNCKDEDRYTPFPFFSLLLYRSFAVFIQFLLPRNKRGSSVNRRRIFETVQAAASRGDDFLLLSFTARILSLSLSLSPHSRKFSFHGSPFSLLFAFRLRDIARKAITSVETATVRWWTLGSIDWMRCSFALRRG